MPIKAPYRRLLGGLLPAFLLFLLVAVLVFKPGAPLSPPSATLSPGQQPQPVKVAEVEAGSSIRELRLSGLLRAAQTTELAFEGGGRLLARPVKVGDGFAAGQVLATLDPEPWQNTVAAAQARLEELEVRWRQADNERRRLARLAEAGAVSQDEFERAESAAAALKAARRTVAEELREASRMLAATELAAPFAGSVAEVLAEPGEYLAAGRPVLRLNADGATAARGGDDREKRRLAGFELMVEVPESLLSLLPPAQSVAVALPRAGLELPGTVRSVADASPLAPSLFPVLVEIPAAPGLRPGQLAEIRLQVEEQGAWLVPPAAVINPGGDRPALMRLGPDGGVERVTVKLGSLTGERLAVFGPLRPGDRVLVSGFSTLAAGAVVEAIAEEPGP
ncbi:efflux RND transporter periplasmic adaptor subunit [Desulfurivibrio alkaliphilus]|uniref:Efflux transporter, RND family, MFP subunit n=1 Tax=Desulfurivibrio alkaliphilus (strain DSM 19089 / UNIQEM U267 / AHT2) TaxID=589865 RepID=D6Z0R3_DESAT|nr:efflux RND transporter periplasmic adaptor subunit [Desulfurivibrio alkaliphilus]ADH85292.1 efflux transporter, RND family, MFP subunit [Desulfurivibrio alkaliphilus AHT 2]